MRLKFSERSHVYTVDGKRWSSVSSIAKILDDSFRLQKWQQRMVAIGVASDQHLVERVCAHFDDRDILDEICEEAAKAAGAHKAAERGTAIHRITERVDAGEALIRTALSDDVMWKWNEIKRIAGIEMACDSQGRPLSERIVLWPDQHICGKFDRVGRMIADNRLVLVDTKSGKNAVSYPHSIAIQLALYTNAPLLAGPLPPAGGETEEFEDFQALGIDLERALVIHMPDGEDAQVYEFDIAAGMEAARLCFGAMAWRKQASLCWPLGARSEDGDLAGRDRGQLPVTGVDVDPHRDAVPPRDNDDPDVRRDEPVDGQVGSEGDGVGVGLDPAALLAAIEALPADVYDTLKRYATERQLPAPKRLAAATPEQLVAVAAAVQQAKDACLYETQFITDVRIEEGRRELIERSRRSNDARDDQPVAGAGEGPSPNGRGGDVRDPSPLPTPEEGPPADPAAIDALTRHLAQLTAPQQNIIKDWLAQARAAGVFFGNLKQNPTVRRFSLARACWALVAHMDGDDELVRLALAFVAGDDAVQPAFPTGAVIGALTPEQADRLHEVATGIGERYILGAGRLEAVA